MVSEIWKNDDVQFPRLLSEILAAGLPEETLEQLCNSMDLQKSEIFEILERADRKFEQIKNELCDKDSSVESSFILDESSEENEESDIYYEVDIPSVNHEDSWINVTSFSTKHEAVRFIEEYYGGDEEGRICLISEISN
jgi:hypothetical protein